LTAFALRCLNIPRRVVYVRAVDAKDVAKGAGLSMETSR
jgi:hypothetical protein